MEIFLSFLKLGLTSFGGPFAHISYFRDEFVIRRKWLPETLYGELVTLCQFLPGPTSSQVGFLIGLMRGGPLGAFAAWLGFTAPSAVVMALFAYGLVGLGGPFGQALMHGLKLVAVIVVAQALSGMTRSLAPDRTRMLIALLSALLILLSGQQLFQLLVILVGGGLGIFFCRDAGQSAQYELRLPVNRLVGILAWIILGVALLGFPLLVKDVPSLGAAVKIFQSGSFVFGGGHVVLPLLEQGFVAPLIIDKNIFLAGYGAAQAIPGPLFTFATYLGVLAPNGPGGITGAALATFAIFLPGFLILIGVLPFWTTVRTNSIARSMIAGANAAVVGILGAALYQPIWTSSVMHPSDFILVIFGYALLMKSRLPSLAVVLTLPIASVLLTQLGF